MRTILRLLELLGMTHVILGIVGEDKIKKQGNNRRRGNYTNIDNDTG